MNCNRVSLIVNFELPQPEPKSFTHLSRAYSQSGNPCCDYKTTRGECAHTDYGQPDCNLKQKEKGGTNVPPFQCFKPVTGRD